MTSLIGGERVSKSHAKVEAYGILDELNSFVGMLRAEISRSAQPQNFSSFQVDLHRLQNRLFDLGSVLAKTKIFLEEKPITILNHETMLLEKAIDSMNESLPTLKSFILPGDNPISAVAHVVRPVCRRLERQLCILHREENIPSSILAFVNRLSDYFFVFSRFASKELGTSEILWDIPLN